MPDKSGQVVEVEDVKGPWTIPMWDRDLRWGARSAILDAEPPTFLGDAKHSTHPAPVRLDAMFIPRLSLFISILLRASVQQRVQTTSKIFPPAPFSAAE